MDFTNVPVGTEIVLMNMGPDEPFGGGVPGVAFEPADPASTGQVMQFRVKGAEVTDNTTPPMDLVLPTVLALGPPDVTRAVSLNEEESLSVRVSEVNGGLVEDCAGEIFGPTAALLGTLVEQPGPQFHGGLGDPQLHG
jgi:hypothetical protein